MIDEPYITQTEAQRAAVIRISIPRSEIRHVMGPAMREVVDTIAAQGVKQTGPLFSHHLWMAPDEFNFEVGVPVAQPVSAQGRVKPGELPAAKVARTVYHGSYEGLGAAWGEFESWIRANGHDVRVDLWEVYLSGPESHSDPANFRTELTRPLAG